MEIAQFAVARVGLTTNPSCAVNVAITSLRTEQKKKKTSYSVYRAKTRVKTRFDRARHRRAPQAKAMNVNTPWT